MSTWEEDRVLFLIEYDRLSGTVQSLSRFDDTMRTEASSARLKLEIELNQKGIDREVALLEAASEEALKRTHRRYFEGLSTLISDLRG